MNYFNLPRGSTWLKLLGWVVIKLALSGLQFLILVLEKSLTFLLWCTKMFQRTLDKIVFIVDHIIYTGVPQAKQERLDAVQVEALPTEIQINFFDFTQFRNNPDQFPHIRVIGKTGIGKTRFTEWIMDMLGGYQFVITPKKKPTDWINHKVYGHPFKYDECESKLAETHQLVHKRYELMEQGITPHQINFACDEWKLINKNVPSAKELMKDIIIVARDAKIRLIALAQGENVATWGLEGESDLEECFTTVRFGDFATEHCKFLRNKYRKESGEFYYYSAVLKELEAQGFRCCMVEHQPARVPDLSNWKPSFKLADSQLQSANNEVVAQLQKQLQSELENSSETTQNQQFQAENQDGEVSDRALWEAVKTALLTGKSVDWCSKNIPGLPGNYYSARRLVEDLISKHSTE